MEQPAVSSGEPSQAPSTASAEENLTRHTIASLRSLIINPSTPASLISATLETLTKHLQFSRDPLLLHHILKLLSELSQRSPDHSAVVSQSVHTFLLNTESPRLAAESLDILASISENEQTFDDSFFLSLCFESLPPLRLWLLKNAGRFRIRSHLLFTIFLGFTKDPYPYVRQAALEGLISLSKSGGIEDHSLIKGCYDRAVDLLGDTEAFVRIAAVRTVIDSIMRDIYNILRQNWNVVVQCVYRGGNNCTVRLANHAFSFPVGEWGQMLVSSTRGTDKIKWSDAVFIQLSSMVRDMSVGVRVAAFDALGKTEMVSVGVLLQTLSKKVLDIMKENKCPGQGSRGQSEAIASKFAGALLHGLEDEYHEVRSSACRSMQKLTVLSSKFASEAMNLLTDMLNDDSVAVRFQALETMFQMANCGHLSLKVSNMDMFLSSLTDSNSLIRDAGRKVLKSVRLQHMELFRLSVYGLIESLQRYHQDEVEIFSVLFHLGRHHGSFTVSLINQVFREIEPAFDGTLGFDNARVAAFLVLAVAAPLCPGKNNCKIPTPIFSYAVTILGRISGALADEVDQDTLLAYLSHCSRGSTNPLTDSKEIPSLAKSNGEILTDSDENEANGFSPVEMDYEVSKIDVQKMNSGNLPSSNAKFQLETDDRILKSMNIVLSKTEGIWSLVKSGLLNEGLRTLRACKRELAIFASELDGTSPSLAFADQYLRIVKLLAQIYVHFLPTANYCNYSIGDLDLLLAKLDRRLRDTRCRFIGLSKEEDLRILELLLVSSVIQLSKLEICCEITVRKLSAVLTQIEHLQGEASIRPSSFVTIVRKFACNIPCHPSLFRKALDHFSLEKYELSGSIEYVSAKLSVPGNNSDNPLCFVPGLPVAIPIEVKLSSISRERRLWLKMVIGEESTQFLYLDKELYAGSSSFSYSAPFYRTPKALFFTLRISIGMECEYESFDVATRRGGPRHELTFLTPEIDVYLSSARY